MTLLPSSLRALLFAAETLPFSVALAVVSAIAVLEAVALLLGLGLGSLLDVFSPGSHALGIPAQSSSMSLRAIAWLEVGGLPLLAVLVLALSWFGLAGLVLQALHLELSRGYLPVLQASALASVASVPLTRVSAGMLGRVMPKDETTAVSRASFCGRVAVMLQATAHPGHAAQAKLYDQHGQPHYVLVEPEDDHTALEAGSEVLLIHARGSRFTAIANPHRVLSPTRRD
ncbi:MAG: hypothetical protein JWN48_4132 [Myxococcaceae bacterium]|nr:hypothetical protein [Myxococcaceae bacterium]